MDGSALPAAERSEAGPSSWWNGNL